LAILVEKHTVHTSFNTDIRQSEHFASRGIMNNYKYVKEIGRGNYGQALLCIHNLDSQKVNIA